MHNILGMVLDKLVPRQHREKSYIFLIPEKDIWSKLYKTLSQLDYVLYTDSSKTKKRGRARVFYQNPRVDISINLSNLATISQAEMMAIELGAGELIISRLQEYNNLFR